MAIDAGEETDNLLLHAANGHRAVNINDDDGTAPPASSVEDPFNLGYAAFFILGAGFLLPWNAFITAVDYFSYLYPSTPVDRIFSVAYMVPLLVLLFLILLWAHKSSAGARINSGLALFTVALIAVPMVDAVYVKGRVGLYPAFWFTVGAIGVCAVADALVQAGVIGSAGELPEQYMQATIAGGAASGVLVSAMRIFTKAMYSQDAQGLRSSAILYFVVTIVVLVICLVCYNLAQGLPVVVHYKNEKMRAIKEESSEGVDDGSVWRSTLWDVVWQIKGLGAGTTLIYIVTLSIFPGYITEDVHSKTLKDWYPIILITGYNVFDLIGRGLNAVYRINDANTTIAGCAARLLFYPLYLACLHGPSIFRTEIPVTVLTCLLGLTNGYLTTEMMVLATKAVPIQRSETAGIAMVLFLATGLMLGSLVSWFWVI